MKRLWLGILVLGVTVNSQPLFAREEITGFNQIILAQTPSPSPKPTQTTSPSPTPKKTDSPSPNSTKTPSPSPTSDQDQDSQDKDSSNSGWMLLFFVQGVIFLVFKGFEVFSYEKKMLNSFDNLGKQINQLVSIPDHLRKLTLEVKALREQSETSTKTINEQLDEKFPNPLEIEAISQQISKDLNQLIETILREKLEQQFSVIVPLLVQKILENSEFIESLSQSVANKINTNSLSVLPGQSSETINDLGLPSLPENPQIQGSELSDEGDHQSDGLTDEERDIVKKYNDRKLSLTKDLITVTTSKDTILDRRSGRESLAILIADRQGSYWVITGENSDHYLVPNYDKIFNTSKMRTLGTLFELLHYEQGVTNSKRFQLKKPAKVSVITAGEQWELIENSQGILDFQ